MRWLRTGRIILSYIVGIGLSKSARRWRPVVLAAVFIAGLMVAMALGVHWIVIALIAAFGAACAVVVTGTSAAKLYVRRLMWPRGVADVDHRDERTFLLDDHDELGVTTDEQTRMGEELRSHRIALARRPYVPLLVLVVVLGPLAGLTLLNLPTAVEWAILGVLLALMPFIWRRSKVAQVRWRSLGLVAIGRCPSCGYDLLNLPVADDGCSVCPECGAAWRVPPDDQAPDAGEPTV